MVHFISNAVKNIARENWKSILAGSLLGVVFAPFQISFWFVYIALIPFLEDLSRARSIKDALVKGYWFGIFSALSALNWIAFNTVPGFIALLVLHPWSYMIFAVFFFIFWKHLKKRAVFPSAVLWIVLEVARSWGQLRFPWINLYYTLSYDINFIQVIEYTGPIFLSLFIFTINISFWLLIRSWIIHRKIYKVSILYILSGILIYLSLSMHGADRINNFRNNKFPVIKTGIVQPDIDAYLKWMDKYKDLAYKRLFSYSDSLAKENVKLIVWPETALPTYVRNNAGIFTKVQNWVVNNNIPLITGIPDFESKNNRYYFYNAVWLVHPDTIDMDVYYKHFLVPGGETIPFKNYIPVLEDIHVGGGNFWPGRVIKTLDREFSLPMGEYSGSRWKPFVHDKHDYILDLKVIPAICYESIYPELLRYQKLNNSGNILAVITNDGWYGRTPGPYQHLRASVFRAIETRISVIRSANNGVSAFVDPTGELYEETQLFTDDYRWAYLPVVDITTIYEKYGIFWVWILTGMALIWLAYHEIFKYDIVKKVDNKRMD